MRRNAFVLDPASASNESAREALERAVKAVIDAIDASASAQAVAEAHVALGAAAERLKAITRQHLIAAVCTAACAVSASSTRLDELAAGIVRLKEELAHMPRRGAVDLFLALLYAGAAATAFLTELKLMDALIDVMGYRSDDPVAKAIGAAFASSLFVFELVFARLGLVSDPWPFFRGTAGPEGAAPTRRDRTLRVTAGVALLVVLVAILVLEAATIAASAPVRGLGGMLQRDPQLVLSADQHAIVENAVLLFSLSVLVSGGFLAAAASHELRALSGRWELERGIGAVGAAQRAIEKRLAEREKPALVEALNAANLRYAALDEADLARLRKLLEDPDAMVLPPGVGDSDAALFLAEKRITLEKALQKPAPPRAQRSLAEAVDVVIETSGLFARAQRKSCTS